jgi:SAM-dependent methyltransferase
VIESSVHSRTDTATSFAWACPVCRTDLVAKDASARCPVCDTVYARRDAIWRFLPRSRQNVFAQFLREYQTVRRREGWGHAEARYYRALPAVSRRDPNRAVWRLRARSLRVFEQQIVQPLEQQTARPLTLIDLGAGNGWLAHRLARRGHRVAAVDLQTNAFDGLGAHVHYGPLFTPVQAEFERLPFVGNQFDLAIFNGALHYATDYATTLAEALRVLRPDGGLVVLDSPVYHDAGSGAQRVREREARFRQTYGFPSNALACEHYLTWAQLDTLAATLNVAWQVFTPGYDWRWKLRRTLARLRTGCEPASFPILRGCRLLR